MSRYIAMALKVATRSPHPVHRMAAVVVRGGAVLSAACNLHCRRKHAESRALRPHQTYVGATIYVVRTNRKMSKPCPVCMETIRRAGIDTVVYLNDRSEICTARVQ